MNNFRRKLYRTLAGSAMVLSIAGLTGCGGGGKKTPLAAGTISGGLFVLDNTVAGRDASVASLVPLAGATVSLLAEGTAPCTGTAGAVAKTAVTDAAGKWAVTVGDSSKYFVSAIAKTGYNFTNLLSPANCANRTVTAELGAAKTPALFPETTTGANAAVWNTNAAQVTPATTETGTILVNTVIQDPVSGNAITISNLPVLINGTQHSTGVTGTAIPGVLPGAKSLGVVPPASLNAPTTTTSVTVAVGQTNTVTLTLSRKVASFTVTSPTVSLSTGSTHDFAPQCTYTAVTGAASALTNGPIACPAGTVSFAIGTGLGTFNGSVLTVGTITTAQSASVTITGPAGATAPANPTVALTNCPTGTESVPTNNTFSGCASVTAVSVKAPTGTVLQTSAIDLTLEATCTYAKVDNAGAIITGNGAASANVDCPASGLTFTATGLTIAANKLDLDTVGTAQVSVARGTLESAQATAIQVAARNLVSIATSLNSSTVTYSPAPSPTTLTLTANCAYNTGTAYAETRNCLSPNPGIDVNLSPSTGITLGNNFLTEPADGATSITLTMPSTIPDAGGTVGVTVKNEAGTVVANTVTINLVTGPQSCTGETGFCLDIQDATGANGTAGTVSVSGINIPTGGLSGINVVFTFPAGVAFTADSITAGTGWTKLAGNVDTTNRRVSVSLQATATVTANTTFFTVSGTPSATGIHVLSPVITGTPRTSITAGDGVSVITNFTFKNGRITVP